MVPFPDFIWANLCILERLFYYIFKLSPSLQSWSGWVIIYHSGLKLSQPRFAIQGNRKGKSWHGHRFLSSPTQYMNFSVVRRANRLLPSNGEKDLRDVWATSTLTSCQKYKRNKLVSNKLWSISSSMQRLKEEGIEGQRWKKWAASWLVNIHSLILNPVLDCLFLE